VYAAAEAGDLERAQRMMNEVLRDHPKSAKVHYVRAQLYAKQGNLAMGRKELDIAESLEAGLPFATSDSIRALQAELSRTQPAGARHAGAHARFSFAWPSLAFVFIAGVILWVVYRARRSAGNVYSQPRDAMTPAAAPPGTAGGAGTSPSVGAGAGPGIAGGLASGLAAGAGIVAGEAIARHLLDPDRREDSAPLTSEPEKGVASNELIEPDFGVSSRSSWDDDGPAPDDSSGNDDWS
jgi:hypothetical protein